LASGHVEHNFRAPDQAQKRKDYEEEIVKTFYLRNTTLPQELTEIVTSIRQLLDLRRVQQSTRRMRS